MSEERQAKIKRLEHQVYLLKEGEKLEYQENLLSKARQWEQDLVRLKEFWPDRFTFGSKAELLLKEAETEVRRLSKRVDEGKAMLTRLEGSYGSNS